MPPTRHGVDHVSSATRLSHVNQGSVALRTPVARG